MLNFTKICIFLQIENEKSIQAFIRIFYLVYCKELEILLFKNITGLYLGEAQIQTSFIIDKSISDFCGELNKKFE